MDALRAELAAGVGLGGRARRTASPADRARISVFRAIGGVMQRAEEAHPALGRHLSATIRTGMFCSYVPDPASPVSWTAT